MLSVQGVATAPRSTQSISLVPFALCQRVQVRVQKARYVKSPVCHAAQADATSNSKSPSPLAPSTGSTSSEDPPKFFKDDTGALAHFRRRPDGVGLYVRQYNVATGTEARGVVVFVHGWTGHSGYFTPFADYLTENGFNVVTFDLRSHGLSERVDDIRGYAKDVNDFATDSIAILEFAQQQNAGLPCFFWGESMGAQIILLSLTKHKKAAALKALKGFVISGTPVKIPKNLVPPPPVFLTLIALGKLFPKQGMPTTMSANFDESFGDVDRIPEMRADPLIHWENPRLSMMASALRVDRELLQDSKLIDLPFLSLYGDDDIKTEIQYAREMYDDSVSTDKQFKVYEGARHQLLQDKPHITHAVMQDSLEWFKQRLD